MNIGKRTIRTVSRLPYVSLLLGAVAVAVYASSLLPSLLEYDRRALAAGQLWRIATCHWMHWSMGHLFWDVSMFVVLGAVCERISRRKMCLAVFVSAMVIPPILYACSPGMTSYRGLSGLDSALFALAGTLIVRRSMARGERVRTMLTIICLAVFPAKILFEWLTCSAIFVQDGSGMVPVPLAHLIGAIIGVLAACIQIHMLTNLSNPFGPWPRPGMLIPSNANA